MSTPGRTEVGVLIVDDHEGIRQLLQLALPKFGFRVWVAADGVDAMAIYRQQPEAIDVVLLDVNMPRMDGPQTLVALHRENPDIPCVFMTGGCGLYQYEELGQIGVLGVLSKPLVIRDVVATLQRALRSSRNDRCPWTSVSEVDRSEDCLLETI